MGDETSSCFTDKDMMLDLTNENEILVTQSTSGYGIPNYTSAYYLKLDQIGSVLFSKYYYLNGIINCEGRSIQKTKDGGFILGINYASSSFGLGLVKTNSVGDTIWSRKFERNGSFGTTQSQCYYALGLKDNSFIAVGQGYTGQPEGAICRVDSLGNYIFGKRYYHIGGSAMRLYYSIQSKDNHLISVGYYKNPSNPYFSMLLLKTDIHGNIIWAKQYATNDDTFGYELKEGKDKSLYVVASRGYPAGNSDMLLLKTDSLGNTVFTKSYGDTLLQTTKAIDLDSNDNVILTGNQVDYINLSINSGTTTKLDKNGNLIWSKVYNNTNLIGSVKFTPNNELLLAGSTDKFGAGQRDIYLAKTDTLGEAGCDVFPITYTTTVLSTTTTALTLTVSNDMVMVGSPLISGTGCITSVKCASITSLKQEKNNSLPKIEIFPNPSNHLLNFKLNEDVSALVELSDMYGNIFYSLFINNLKNEQINIASIKSGVYNLKIVSKKGISITKFIKN